MTIPMDQMKVMVKGMNCNHCKINVETSLRRIPGIESVVADPFSGEVLLKGNSPDLEKVKAVLDRIGYSYGGILG
jgi:copper chaperone CopZ